jgi:hypothetical protein
LSMAARTIARGGHALAQAELLTGSRDILDTQGAPRMGFREPTDDRTQERDRSGQRTSDPHLATGRVGQELDILDSLPQLIEYRPRARQQRVPVHGGLDTARAAVEKLRAQGVFEIGNHLRHGGLRYAELRGGLCHAPVLDDREEQVQVPQFETPANLTVGIELSWHRQNLIVAKVIGELSYIKIGLVLLSRRILCG